MSELITYFAEHLVAAIIIFLIIFFVLLYFFTKEKLGEAVIGLLKSLASLVYSPFVYVKNILQGLVTNYEKGDKDIVETKQYLLNRLILLFEALLIIMSTAILSVSIIQGWKAILPPEYITSTIDAIKAEITTNEEKFDKLNDEIETLDDQWNDNSEAWITEFKSKQQNVLESKRKENEKLAATFSANPNISGYYEYIQSYLSGESQSFNPDYLSSYLNNAKSYTNYSSIDEYYRTQLEKFIDNWGEIMTAKYNLENFSADKIRFNKQPTYWQLNNDRNIADESLKRLRPELEGYEKQASYKVGAFFVKVLIGLLTYMLFVWIFGVAIELLNLSVNLASNVNSINKKLNESKV